MEKAEPAVPGCVKKRDKIDNTLVHVGTHSRHAGVSVQRPTCSLVTEKHLTRDCNKLFAVVIFNCLFGASSCSFRVGCRKTK